MDLNLYLLNKIYCYLEHPNSQLIKEYFLDKYAFEIMENYIIEFEIPFKLNKKNYMLFRENLDKYAWYPYSLYIGESNKYHLENILNYI